MHDPADPHSLGHDYRELDLGGPFWPAVGGCNLESGVSALDVKTGTIYTLFLSRGGTWWPIPSPKWNLYEDRDGVLWLCTMDWGLLKLDRERRRFVQIQPSSPRTRTVCTTTRYSRLFEDREGAMWVGTQSGSSPFSRTSAVCQLSRTALD